MAPVQWSRLGSVEAQLPKQPSGEAVLVARDRKRRVSARAVAAVDRQAVLKILAGALAHVERLARQPQHLEEAPTDALGELRGALMRDYRDRGT